jgi:hypothetical protein
MNSKDLAERIVEAMRENTFALYQKDTDKDRELKALIAGILGETPAGLLSVDVRDEAIVSHIDKEILKRLAPGELRRVQADMIDTLMRLEEALQKECGPDGGRVMGIGANLNVNAWLTMPELMGTGGDIRTAKIVACLHDMNEGHTIFEDHGPEDPHEDDTYRCDECKKSGPWSETAAGHCPHCDMPADFVPHDPFAHKDNPPPLYDDQPEPDGPQANPWVAEADLERDRQIYPGIHPDA